MRIKDLMVAMLAVGAAAVSLYFVFAGRSEKVNVDTYEVLGAVTAEETAKLLGNKGQVLVMARDAGADKNPSVEAELKAFRRTLKKHPGLGAVTEKVQVTPMLLMATGGGRFIWPLCPARTLRRPGLKLPGRCANASIRNTW